MLNKNHSNKLANTLILEYLSVQELGIVSQVSKVLNEFVKKNKLLKHSLYSKKLSKANRSGFWKTFSTFYQYFPNRTKTRDYSKILILR